MRRFVTSSILLLLILVILAAGIFAVLRWKGGGGGDALEAIPADAAFYVSIGRTERESIAGLPWWQSLSSGTLPVKVFGLMDRLEGLAGSAGSLRDLLNRQPLIIAASPTKSDDFDLLFLMSVDGDIHGEDVENLVQEVSGKDPAPVRVRSYEGVDLHEISLHGEGNLTVTWAVSRNVFIASCTSFLVEDAIRQQGIHAGPIGSLRRLGGSPREDLVGTGHAAAMTFRQFAAWASVFCATDRKAGVQAIGRFADEAVLQWSADEHGLWLEGKAYPGDSAHLVRFLAGQRPERMTLADALPLKTAFAGLVACRTEDWFRYFARYRSAADSRQLEALQEKFGVDFAARFAGWSGGQFGLLITEPAGTGYANSACFLVHSRDGNEARESLDALCETVDRVSGVKTLKENYGAYRIGWLRTDGLIPLLFGSYYGDVQRMYFTVVNDLVAFANQPSALRGLIDEMESRNTLLNSPAYRQSVLRLAEHGNFLLYVRTAQSKYLARAILSESWNRSLMAADGLLAGWNSMALQVQGGHEQPAVRIELRYGSHDPNERSDLLWSLQMDTTAGAGPFVVRDLPGGRIAILVQDAAHRLYKLNASGDLIWKKDIGDRIEGPLVTIDLYRTSHSQYLFNTGTHIQLLDQGGGPMHNFPIRLPARATTGMLVTGPDLLKKYQIYIPCSNGVVYAYEGSGKPLPGWNFSDVTGPVTDPFVDLAVGGLRLIAGSDDAGRVYLLDATGSEAMAVSGPVHRLPGAEFHALDREGETTVVTADRNGNPVQVLSNGETEVTPLEETDGALAYVFVPDNPEHLRHAFLVDGRLVGFDDAMEETLNIEINPRDKPDALRLDSLRPGQYVLVSHSSGSDKAYMHRLSGTIVKGFPVRGGLGSCLADLNNDGRKYFISLSPGGIVYTYSMAR